MKHKSLSTLFSALVRKPWRLIVLTLTAALAQVFILAGPRLVGRAIDSLLQNDGRFDATLLLMLMLYVAGVGLLYVSGLLTTGIGADASHDLRRDVYAKLQRLPLSFIDATPAGHVANRVGTDITGINDGIVSGLPQVVAASVAVTGSLWFMFRIDWLATLAMLALLPLTYAVSWFIAKNTRQLFLKASALLAEINALTTECVENDSLIRRLTAGEDRLERQKQLLAKLHSVGKRAYFFSALSNPTTRLVNAASYLVVGGVAAFSVLNGRLTPGDLTGLLGYANLFAKPVNELTAVFAQFQAQVAALERVLGLLAEAEEPDESDKPDLVVTDGHVQFDRVTFSYQADRPLLNDFSLDVPANTMVAIVGPTGAGKTTLVNLLMRFYEPEAGRILIDGTDIRRVNRASVRRAFAMVLQDTWLFPGSLRANITLGRAVPDERLQATIESAGIAGFAARLPDGLDTHFDGTSGLSEGQRQLLTVARALVQARDIVILDEATAYTDTLTEARVQHLFRRMTEEKTSFVIAHRLKTILDAGLILVLDEGRIVERGTHRRLIEKGGLYAALYERQFQGWSLDDSFSQIQDDTSPSA